MDVNYKFIASHNVEHESQVCAVLIAWYTGIVYSRICFMRLGNNFQTNHAFTHPSIHSVIHQTPHHQHTHTQSCFHSSVHLNSYRVTKRILLNIKSETKSTRSFSNWIVLVNCLRYHEDSKRCMSGKSTAEEECLSCTFGRSETREYRVKLNAVAIFGLEGGGGAPEGGI
jgi:hypothetical protein